MMGEKISISVSPEIKKKLEAKSKESDFGSVQEYITYILSQVVSEENEDQAEDFDEEEAKIQERKLKELGYI